MQGMNTTTDTNNADYFATACEFCYGTGIYVDLKGNRFVDPNCGGSGQKPQPCPDCNGFGEGHECQMRVAGR